MEKILTISEVNKYISDLLANDYVLNNLCIKGEVSNLRDIKYSKWKTKYVFFSLKDENSVIEAITFSENVINAFENKEVENGSELIARCSITSYWKNGRYSLKILEIINTKVGAISQKIEALKQKLFKLGYFDKEHKVLISDFPRNIGLIAGDNSAAYNDIKKTIFNRYSLVTNFYFFPCLVQGEAAIKEILKTIEKTKNFNIDVLIISRGGGSIEDLSVFSEEEVVMKMFNYHHAPIVTGIGHEINTSIADLVADHHAVTPTAAAEYVTRNSDDIILNFLKDSQFSINKNIKNIAQNYWQEIGYLTNNLTLKINNILKNKEKSFFSVSEAFKKLTKNFIKNQTDIITENKFKLITFIRKILSIKLSNWKSLYDNLNASNEKYFIYKHNELKSLKTFLLANDISNNLKRGYSIVTSEDKVISDIDNLQINQLIKIKFFKGSATSKIKEILKEKNNK